MKISKMPTFWWLSITCGVLWVKYRAVPFWPIFWVAASQKTRFSALRKWKVHLFVKHVEFFCWQHCSPSHCARMCRICAYLNKLCYESGHNIGSLARKPYIFVLGSFFFRTLFHESFRIASLYFFLLTMPHKMMSREGFALFWFFLNFVWSFQNLVKVTVVTVRVYWLNNADILVDL